MTDLMGRLEALSPEQRAAIEALHFPKLFDRWMQNLRRCAGFRVQYFGAIEPQRRLAPHMHLAIRGAIPRQVLRTVTRATYLQLWWPQFDSPVFTDPESMPAWNPRTRRVEDSAGVPLISGKRRSTSSRRIPTRSRRW